LGLFLLLFRRPSLVVNPVPGLFSSLPVALLVWVVGARAVLHIQDFEVDAMFGLGKGGKAVA
jgi:colanic acid biosynthesis glycosyl transferase WcaI